MKSMNFMIVTNYCLFLIFQIFFQSFKGSKFRHTHFKYKFSTHGFLIRNFNFKFKICIEFTQKPQGYCNLSEMDLRIVRRHMDGAIGRSFLFESFARAWRSETIFEKSCVNCGSRYMGSICDASVLLKQKWIELKISFSG